MSIRKVSRMKAKIRLGLSSVSGGGKTYSALLIAKGMVNRDMSKVCIIDTENGSADLYQDIGEYNVYPLPAPYTPENYVNAITECEKAGMEVIIVDSITHEWSGKGGILEISNSMTGNSYTNWAKLTPRHQRFIDAILTSPCHIITTVRRKQDYDMVTNSQGKLTPQKVGLKEEQREGFEYELTVNLELDTKHNASSSKDRTGLFAGKPDFIPSEETGRLLLEWCNKGAEVTPRYIITDLIMDIKTTSNLDELKAVWLAINKIGVSEQDLIELTRHKDNQKLALTGENNDSK